jgi:hypothetical protein
MLLLRPAIRAGSNLECNPAHGRADRGFFTPPNDDMADALWASADRFVRHVLHHRDTANARSTFTGQLTAPESAEEFSMAKSQRHGNKEAKKPKAVKIAAPAPATIGLLNKDNPGTSSKKRG